MICPKCKECELKSDVSLKGFWKFNKKKVINYFCLNCSFSETKEFQITYEQYLAELRALSSMQRYSKEKDY